MATIFGIDISRYQKGMQLSQAKAEGVEFVIIKAGGADDGKYRDSQFNQFYRQAKAADLTRCAYYFGQAFSVEAAEKEAAHLIQILQGTDIRWTFYDVEGKMLNQGRQHLTDIVKKFCEVMEGAGYHCGIYASESSFNGRMNDDQLIGITHWVARWSRTVPKLTSGARIAIWQFGGETNLLRSNRISSIVTDQNYSYIDITDQGPAEGKEPEQAKKTVEDLAKEVIAGAWGNGSDRKERLTAAGYSYEEVQKRVDEILKPDKKTTAELAQEVLAGVWGNGATRAKKLQEAGYDYKEVQDEVNRIAEMRKQSGKTYIVVKGDTLSRIAKRYGTTVARIVEANSIQDPNKIYVGQEIRIL